MRKSKVTTAEVFGLIENLVNKSKKNHFSISYLCTIAEISCSIKITLENSFGIVYNRKRIQRIMRKYNIVCPIRKANPYRRMAKATKEHRVVPNLLNINFKQNIVGKALLIDITYFPYGTNQMAYLSTIKDASTNEILSYNVSNSLELDIVMITISKFNV